MSGDNHWFDPRIEYGGRGSDRRDERGGGRGGSSDGYNDGRYGHGGPGQHGGLV